MIERLESEILHRLADTDDRAAAARGPEPCGCSGSTPLCGCRATWICENTTAISESLGASVDPVLVAIALTQCRMRSTAAWTPAQVSEEVTRAVAAVANRSGGLQRPTGAGLSARP
jgi:hypothetical protein